jgi:hemerythrin
MAIEWNDSYAVGVEVIDAQHRELFRRISSLVEAMGTGQGKDQVADVIRFLGDYVVVHFQTEEQLMDQRGFPEAVAHKKEHADFAATLARLKAQLTAEGPSAALAIDVNNKVCNWMVRHLLGTDRTLATFLKGKA